MDFEMDYEYFQSLKEHSKKIDWKEAREKFKIEDRYEVMENTPLGTIQFFQSEEDQGT